MSGTFLDTIEFTGSEHLVYFSLVVISAYQAVAFYIAQRADHANEPSSSTISKFNERLRHCYDATFREQPQFIKAMGFRQSVKDLADIRLLEKFKGLGGSTDENQEYEDLLKAVDAYFSFVAGTFPSLEQADASLKADQSVRARYSIDVLLPLILFTVSLVLAVYCLVTGQIDEATLSHGYSLQQVGWALEGSRQIGL